MSQPRTATEGIASTDTNRDWSLAHLSKDDVLRLQLDVENESTLRLPESDIVVPESATLSKEMISVLCYSGTTENWYQLRQCAEDRHASEVRCEVDTGSGWERVELSELPTAPATARQTRGNVLTLTRDGPLANQDLDLSPFRVRYP
jgi:hypothetical protein